MHRQQRNLLPMLFLCHFLLHSPQASSYLHHMALQHLDNKFLAGRGAQHNPDNKFAAQHYVQEHVEGVDDWENEVSATRYIKTQARTLLNRVTSDDLPMAWSANPYAGCEHGCVYCYARNAHEYLGYSAGIDFEQKIVVKQNAAQLLRKAFEKKSWVPEVISLSGNTDCYQPAERKFKLTRQLLQLCAEYRNPVGIITKNALILRDLDLLQELNAHNLVRVYTSITSMDEGLRLRLEPRTSTYKNRLATLARLSAAGIPTGVMNAPIIPGLNDMHMPQVLEAAANAGVQWAGYTVVRLNGAVGELFRNWLRHTFPDRADKVWSQIEQLHGGQVNDSRIGTRMAGEGVLAKHIHDQFKLFAKKYGLNQTKWICNKASFRRAADAQASLF